MNEKDTIQYQFLEVRNAVVQLKDEIQTSS
jgi:hypothetical protein